MENASPDSPGVPTTQISRSKISGSRGSSRMRWFGVAALLTASLALTACGAKITKHGHHLRAGDVQQVQAGMGQDEVRLALGTPATTSRSQARETYYYVSSTMSQTSFFKPKEVDRKVVAVYFSPLGSVQRVANYGLKDGKVFDFISRRTPTANAEDISILRSLFRNIGQRGIASQT